MSKRKKNILLLMDYAAPYTGNFIPSIRTLEQSLSSQDRKIVFAFPARAEGLLWLEEFASADRQVVLLKHAFVSKRPVLKGLKELMKLSRRENIGIIHTHFLAQNFNLFLHHMLRPGVRVVGSFLNHFEPPRNKYRPLKVQVVKHTFSHIFGSSQSVSDGLIRQGFKSRKISTLYNSLDTVHLETGTEIRIRDQEAQTVVLMFAWRFMRKGVDYAIDAIHELNQEGGNFLLALAYAADDSYIEAEVLKHYGSMPPWIRLLGSSTDIASLYNGADIFLSASREEGFTYSVLEASYCKPMIVVSKIGGHPQDIPHSVVYEKSDRDALKDALLKMSRYSKEERDSIKAAQREYVASTYDVKTWAGKTVALYLRLLKK